jgi:hypothetical protein
VAECLLRQWRLLPLGLYRRAAATAGVRANAQTAAAAGSAAGAPGVDGAGTFAFSHNRALVSYVFTSPPPGTPLGDHDLVFALRADDGDLHG